MASRLNLFSPHVFTDLVEFPITNAFDEGNPFGSVEPKCGPVLVLGVANENLAAEAGNLDTAIGGAICTAPPLSVIGQAGLDGGDSEGPDRSGRLQRRI
jgi:hypothetical protein